MRALTVLPGQAGSLAVAEVPDPGTGEEDLLVEGLAMGICGTDREIAAGRYGWASPGRDRLVIGHESLGRVRRAPRGSGFSEGDYVVGVVRRPDPVPCGACARGKFDMCRNGRYTERGIKELDGYGSELWRVDPAYAVRLDPNLAETGVLMEPASVVAKAWDEIERIGGRSWFEPRSVLVTGAGPIGLLAALLGVERGLDVHVLDRVTGGPKPRLVRELGATYHDEDVAGLAGKLRPDIVIEATGAAPVVLAAMTATGPYGIVCLTGVSSAGRRLSFDTGAANREIVLENDVVFGSVNANLHHYRLAADALTKAPTGWLSGLISRRVPLEDFPDAFERRDDDVKVVLTLGETR
ncbi:glucose 1-dehydrogenase [Amycolatopsis cynarae]|uniref:Glucose 1-dehydrogenase n=1 Tax=Amycolatopsis cynarae TaxID=2995223 RepID=A0ABY7BAF9_9PSEU|nr:glucose 1-dehydrogenase [Amycolatopsis sp. HUAS 11-8]WAL68924.1 glucose 1-dehydrogenase [Amycolatopsis sp. HUAS 11-8]